MRELVYDDDGATERVPLKDGLTVGRPLFRAERESPITVLGGTHVPWSPSVHYLHDVFIQFLACMGCTVNLSIERWGWYPLGGGKVTARIRPAKAFLPVKIAERGALVRQCVQRLVLNVVEPDVVARRAFEPLGEVEEAGFFREA